MDDTGPHNSGWCVRLDWADGTHAMAGWNRSHPKVTRRAKKMAQFWARGPVSPSGISVVEISEHDWRLHANRPSCRAPDCPGAARPSA